MGEKGNVADAGSAAATPQPASDEELSARQAALQAEATAILSELDSAEAFGDAGPLLVGGSYVSGLMCWPDLDVMVHVGPDFSPDDVLQLMQHLVDLPGVVAFDYRDERGPRSPTRTVRDERYHVTVSLPRNDRIWRIDLTLWLNDPHRNVTEWHEELRETVTDAQRRAILRIKDVWHRLPSYPDSVGGQDIYAAVLDDGIETPEQFATWLAQRPAEAGAG